MAETMRSEAGGEISRIVVTFAGAGGEAGIVEAAALAARALRAGLHGLYIRDRALGDLAALPFSAAVGPGGVRLEAVTVDAVERRWQIEERACRRVLTKAGGGTVMGFETVSGDFEACLRAIATRRDLVALAGEPVHLAPEQLTALIRAAGRTASAVMVCAGRRESPAPEAGPVLAIGEGDALAGPAVALAARLARSAGRRLGLLTVDDPGSIAGPAGDLGAGPVEVHHVPFWTQADLRAAIRRIHPSLVVADLRSPGLSAVALADPLIRSIAVPLIILGAEGQAKGV